LGRMKASIGSVTAKDGRSGSAKARWQSALNEPHLFRGRVVRMICLHEGSERIGGSQRQVGGLGGGEVAGDRSRPKGVKIHAPNCPKTRKPLQGKGLLKLPPRGVEKQSDFNGKQHTESKCATQSATVGGGVAISA
jgi:hypothetical protein